MKLSRATLLCATVVLVVFLPVISGAQSITIEGGRGHLGSPPNDSVVTNRPVLFNLHYQNPDMVNRYNISNGFRIYSPNGAVWHLPFTIDTLNGDLPHSNWDLVWGLRMRHGANEDTVGVIGAIINGAGLPPGYDGIPYAIYVGGFDADQAGLTVCIDSTIYWPGNRWLWMTPSTMEPLLEVYPSWGGPYCFTIVNPHCDGEPACLCCDWYTGNVDGDANDLVDVADLSTIVEYLFSGGSLSSCANENNVDVSPDGAVDLSDLEILVDHLFNGTPLPGCPYRN
jgi:hypothetical protein